MADFRVAPPLLNDLEPVDLANRAALLHQQDYPQMTVQLNTDEKTGVTTLMLFYPSSLRKDGRFSEFSIFKFYKDSATGQNITFHFARFNLNLALTRYGTYKEVNVSADRSLDRLYSAKWITDLDLGYNLTKALNIAVGAKNLFDLYPKKQGVPSSTMLASYGTYSPYGFTGGYYYTRLTYAF